MANVQRKPTVARAPPELSGEPRLIHGEQALGTSEHTQWEHLFKPTPVQLIRNPNTLRLSVLFAAIKYILHVARVSTEG